MAAGKGSRFNDIKQLAPIHGEPMVNVTLKQWCQVAHLDVVVCLGAYSSSILPKIKFDVPFIEIDNWHEGLGHNIAAAVERLNQPDARIVIGLADQVGIDADYITHMLRTSSSFPNDIIATAYSGKVGVPALFPARFQHDLKHLCGDNGARSVLLSNQDRVKILSNERAVFDIDTPADLAKWQALSKTQNNNVTHQENNHD